MAFGNFGLWVSGSVLCHYLLYESHVSPTGIDFNVSKIHSEVKTIVSYLNVSNTLFTALRPILYHLQRFLLLAVFFLGVFKHSPVYEIFVLSKRFDFIWASGIYPVQPELDRVISSWPVLAEIDGITVIDMGIYPDLSRVFSGWVTYDDAIQGRRRNTEFYPLFTIFLCIRKTLIRISSNNWHLWMRITVTVTDSTSVSIPGIYLGDGDFWCFCDATENR